MFLFLPFHIFMSPFQGAALNWWAHSFGYRNFNVKDTSKNIIPIDLLFWGEAYHNNHHKFPARLNNAKRWFEIDLGYWCMRLIEKARIIRINPA
jgi:stearoyl-CoA desaturase (delta-9 desaturase)